MAPVAPGDLEMDRTGLLDELASMLASIAAGAAGEAVGSAGSVQADRGVETDPPAAAGAGCQVPPTVRVMPMINGRHPSITAYRFPLNLGANRRFLRRQPTGVTVRNSGQIP